MNTNKLKELLDKIPFALLLVGFLGYQAYDYYDFTTAPESPLIQRKAKADTVRGEISKLQAKLKDAQEFLRSLEAKKAELRVLAQTLQDLKSTLNTDPDAPGFMKMVVTEARRVGLTVAGIKPVSKVTKEFYEEHPYELAFKGVYVQLLVFLDRLSNIQNIVRVDDFEMKPELGNSARFVELGGTVKISTYRYLGTKADGIGVSAPAGAPATTPAPASAPAAPPRGAGGGKG